MVEGLPGAIIVALVMIIAFVCYCVFGTKNNTKSDADLYAAEAAEMERLKE